MSAAVASARPAVEMRVGALPLLPALADAHPSSGFHPTGPFPLLRWGAFGSDGAGGLRLVYDVRPLLYP